MFNYYITATGNIKYVTKANQKLIARDKADLTLVQSTQEFKNPADYSYNGTSFVKKQDVPYTISSIGARTGETVTITFPDDTDVTVSGPDLSEKATTDSIEFASDRKGKYIFTMYKPGYRVTTVKVEVY